MTETTIHTGMLARVTGVRADRVFFDLRNGNSGWFDQDEDDFSTSDVNRETQRSPMLSWLASLNGTFSGKTSVASCSQAAGSPSFADSGARASRTGGAQSSSWMSSMTSIPRLASKSEI